MSASDGLGSDHQEANRKISGNTGFFHVKAEEMNRPICRRVFVNKIGKIIALGALAHFTLLTGTAFAANDDCPGGLPADDTCNPPDNNDKCPGEAPPADECPADGNIVEDECHTGGTAADICNEIANPTSDECESGSTDDDICDINHTRDNCPTGQASEDYCPPSGGVDIDLCLGGGATTHGQVQDTCQDGVGDACTQGTWWIFPSDNCTEAVPDECSATDNDACYDGTNTPDGHGGTDFCDPDPHPIGLGSDQCNDGTPEQDICSGNSTNPNDGLYDTCPGGETNVDTCAPTPPVNSEDYCVGGLPNNDECYPPDDSDECPGGGPNEDKCPTGAPPEDECTGSGGCSGGDQEGSEPPIDDCYAPQDSCTIASPDNPE